MDLLLLTLLLLFLLLISNIVSHYITAIPSALTQIAMGIALAAAMPEISFEMETEWFLLLFVAPLLYNDGSRFSREELWQMRAPILGNAIVLVVLTTLGGGYFIYWMIPGMPLPAAFALAAILSPTDPVAVNGIARRVRLPHQILALVRGESLINDASGLVAFNYAVAAVVTGHFVLSEALLDFGYKFFAGAVLGLALGFGVILVRFALRRQGIADVTFHALLQILTPFLVYIVSEEFLGASGVIAVVAAGLVHSLIRERTETILAEEQVLTEHIWSLALFVLNGLVFLLLGLNIPASISGEISAWSQGSLRDIGYVAAVSLVILAIRFVWSRWFFCLDYCRSDQARYAIKPDWRTALLISLTGVRGAVTMAGVLSVPYLLANGEPFPQRPLLIFIAAGVILFTLLAATFCLPLLGKKEAGGKPAADFSLIKKTFFLEVIRRIKLEMKEENRAAAYELINEYRSRIRQIDLELSTETRFQQRRLTAIRLRALKEERLHVRQRRDRQEIDAAVLSLLEEALNRREHALLANAGSDFWYSLQQLIRDWRQSLPAASPVKADSTQALLAQAAQWQALQAAYYFLENYVKNHPQSTKSIYRVMAEYRTMMERLQKPRRQNRQKRDEQKEDLRLQIMDIERSEIRRMLEDGEISREQAKELRRFVNNIESITLYEYVE
ncbi:MAG: Na+/H+ antiporter [Sporomusaceae bacterium]|nr:Na+/H+ antiporter [Sporomusaceae bacterium]